jgi:hypothetical protein
LKRTSLEKTLRATFLNCSSSTSLKIPSIENRIQEKKDISMPASWRKEGRKERKA